MSGVPGSGKSTLAKRPEETAYLVVQASFHITIGVVVGLPSNGIYQMKRDVFILPIHGRS